MASFSASQCALSAVKRSLSSASSFSIWRQALPRVRVGLLLAGPALDLQLDHLAPHVVDLRGHASRSRCAGGCAASSTRSMALSGQEAVGDVAVGEGGGGHQGGVLDAHAVVHLVALLEAAQDADGVVHGGLAHHHRLEAPLQGRVLLDVLAVLVQRGGADAVQLAARQRRLEHVARVHRALGLARADDGVQLVDEEDDLPGRVGHLLEHRLEALLELAAELGPGHHGAQVQRDQPLVLEALGHVAVDDAPRQALDDGRLAHARLADEHRVVLGAPAESTWMQRRISSSRPMTGSSFPARAASVRSRPYFSSAR